MEKDIGCAVNGAGGRTRERLWTTELENQSYFFIGSHWVTQIRNEMTQHV